jgi:hypothetical protein
MRKLTDYSSSSGWSSFFDNVLRKIFVALWIFYVIAPLSGGFPWGRFLEYHWLPNESFDEHLHESVSPNLRCRTLPDEDVECADALDVWKDKETGRVYSKDDFKQHRRHEAIRMLLPWSIYGLIGSCLAGVHALVLKRSLRFATKTFLVACGVAAFYVAVIFFDNLLS